MKLTAILCASLLLSRHVHVVGCLSKSGVVAPTSGIIRVYIRFASSFFTMNAL